MPPTMRQQTRKTWPRRDVAPATWQGGRARVATKRSAQRITAERIRPGLAARFMGWQIVAKDNSARDYTIAALWMEGPLSFLEQLCLKSFVDAGHHVTLYHYGPVLNVPDQIEMADANDVLPRTDFLTHSRTGSPALHSDLFRYRMLAQSEDTIWADTDAYCMKRFETVNGHFYGWESTRHINGGVLGLPKDSDTLGELLEYTSDEFAIPPWYGEDYIRELEEAREAGNPVHVSEQPWGVWGPHAVTHFLHKTGEAKYALAQDGLYPFAYRDRRMMLKRNFDTSDYVPKIPIRCTSTGGACARGWWKGKAARRIAKACWASFWSSMALIRPRHRCPPPGHKNRNRHWTSR